MTTDSIPLVDLGVQRDAIAEDVAAGFERVLKSCGFVGGPEVAAFEEQFAAFSGARYCVGVANGTDAIELALRALDIGAGDEVVVPANTFVATAEAVVRVGASPVFVDCDPDTYLIDPARARAALGPRTRAVVLVHL